MAIEFSLREGVYTGTDGAGRQWRIHRVTTGWRLEFQDRGDATGTNAGVHRSAGAAQKEAGRGSGPVRGRGARSF